MSLSRCSTLYVVSFLVRPTPLTSTCGGALTSGALSSTCTGDLCPGMPCLRVAVAVCCGWETHRQSRALDQEPLLGCRLFNRPEFGSS